MNKKKTIIIVSIIILLALVFLLKDELALYNNELDIETGTDIRELAPDFNLNTINEGEIALSQFRGKKVLLNFWATWCPPCQIEMPYMQKIEEDHEDIKILAVNVRESSNTAQEFVLRNNYTFTVPLDTSGKISNTYLVRGIPTTYFLDENGVIINQHTGALSYEGFLENFNITP